jgi:hypothetical protein
MQTKKHDIPKGLAKLVLLLTLGIWMIGSVAYGSAFFLLFGALIGMGLFAYNQWRRK